MWGGSQVPATEVFTEHRRDWCHPVSGRVNITPHLCGQGHVKPHICSVDSVAWMNSGSLSADGCGCVTTILVAWREASQHWILQAVEWVEILMPIWWLLESHVDNLPWNSHHHSLSPLLPRSKTHRWSGLGSYGVTALLWVPVHIKYVIPPRVESLISPVLWNS